VTTQIAACSPVPLRRARRGAESAPASAGAEEIDPAPIVVDAYRNALCQRATNAR
jgi:hypothetical protein